MARPSSIQGSWVGSAKKQCTLSPYTSFSPKATPPGPPPTPQGRYTKRGWSASTATPISFSCFSSRRAATAYPRNRVLEFSSSTKWQQGSAWACRRPSSTALL